MTRFGKNSSLYVLEMYDTKILYTWIAVANMTRFGKKKFIVIQIFLYTYIIYTWIAVASQHDWVWQKVNLVLPYL